MKYSFVVMSVYIKKIPYMLLDVKIFHVCNVRFSDMKGKKHGRGVFDSSLPIFDLTYDVYCI
jgi:hypothetical protein